MFSGILIIFVNKGLILGSRDICEKKSQSKSNIFHFIIIIPMGSSLRTFTLTFFLAAGFCGFVITSFV